MKIFIGGIKRKHTDKFTKRWPYQAFEFAEEEASVAEWMRLAANCAHHLVYQHRTSHKHIRYLARHSIVPKFTDSTPIMMQMIEEILTTGSTTHSYTKEQQCLPST